MNTRYLTICLCLLCGCGGNKNTPPAKSKQDKEHASPSPKAVTATSKSTGPGSSRDNPISLEQALSSGVCEIINVKDVPLSSRFMRFLLRPKTGKKEWIRIDPVWRLTAKKRKGAAVTVLPAVAQLYAKSNRAIDVFAAELQHSSYAGTEYEPKRMEKDDPLLKLTTTATKMDPRPSWNAMQIAVSVLDVDVDYRRVRKERYSYTRRSGIVAVMGEGGDLARDVSEIDLAFRVLKEAGHQVEGFKLYKETEAEWAGAMKDYSENRKALQALHRIGFFRTRDEPFKVIAATWKERTGEKDQYYRKAALRWLSGMLVDYRVKPRVVNEKARAALEQAASLEPDEKLKKEIARALERAEKAAKK